MRIGYKAQMVAILLALISCTQFVSKNESPVHNKNISNSLDNEQLNNDEKLRRLESELKQILDQNRQSGDEEKIEFLSRDLFLKASDASIRGDSSQALIYFKFLVDLRPNDETLQKKYAIELIKGGSLDDAKIQLENLTLKNDQIDEESRLILAGVYSALSEKEKAEKIYKEILLKSPDNQEACIFLSKAYTEEKKFKKATDLLSKCEKMIKDQAVFSYYKGKIALSEGKIERALQHFKNSLKREPHFHQSVLAIGAIYEEKSELEKSFLVYKNFLDNSPEHPIILNKIVQVLLALSKYKEVLPYFETLTQLFPDDYNLKVKLGILYTDITDYHHAKKIFHSILEKFPKSDKILYYLGAIYQETGDLEKAIEHFSLIEEDSGLYLDSNLQVATILIKYVQKEKENGTLYTHHSKNFLDYVDDKSKTIPDIKLELSVLKANFYESRGDYSSAILILENLKSAKGFNDNHSYYLAALYEKNKQFDEAFQVANKLIEKNPLNAHAWNFLGYSLLDRNMEMDKAYEYIQKAITLKPNDGYIRDSLGWYYFKKGKFSLSLKEMLKAREKVEGDPVISKHLAIVYQSLKMYDQARKYFLEALNNSREEEERVNILNALKMMETPKGRLPAFIKEK